MEMKYPESKQPKHNPPNKTTITNNHKTSIHGVAMMTPPRIKHVIPANKYLAFSSQVDKI